MQNHRRFWIGFLIVLLTLFLSGSITTAQDDSTISVEPQLVELAAADGLTLVGSFYILPDAQAPTALFLHDQNASRGNWTPLVEPMLSAGYNALLVDLRGHGETGGDVDWQVALADVQTWLNWLKEQPAVQATGISIVGADLGGNLALLACESDSECLTSIAISPVAIGCDERDCSEEAPGVPEADLAFIDEMSENTITDESRRTDALLLVGGDDDLSLASIRYIGSARIDRVEFEIVMRKELHGTALLDEALDDVAASTVRWLDARTPANLSYNEIEVLVAAADPENGAILFANGNIDAPQEAGRECSICHLTDSEEWIGEGPGLLGIGERAGTRVAGQSAAVYLYESIVAPRRYLVDGNTRAIMPWAYDKGFTQQEIADMVAFLLTLESD